MFKIDHLMIEVDDPLETANNVVARLALPLAWPLVEKDEYTSIGVNFGDINIEFIKFKLRFGIKNTKFKGFSGIAYKTMDSLEEIIKRLNVAKINHRVGEACEAHTTLPIAENDVFPTIFIVKYHFDTSGWVERLKNEFAEYAGGNYHIGNFKSMVIATEVSESLKKEFNINSGAKNKVFFSSANGENIVISDLIENLEIVIS
ncbi:hypothetical protein [Shewanella dokdonensis]|uniref:Glyoxalase-like domain-containing protein n=1 Tax=Shewanella dokdonensis TaxID=712036 RepID=A0ABX8DCC0_9GAMM|nr:hypothetical protein [Shewanella dokdonensis]MCL1074572.1 hypothetical protein [Shewanella dokdonensis]QVK22410.1 hypothetical protein KHX94_13625 [Shewanella dokdonensis]